MNIGQRIKNLRKQLNMSNRELAQKSGLSQPVMNRLENNERKADIETLEKICKALNITLIDFFAPVGTSEPIRDDLKELLESAKDLTPSQLEAVKNIIKAMQERR